MRGRVIENRGKEEGEEGVEGRGKKERRRGRDGERERWIERKKK